MMQKKIHKTRIVSDEAGFAILAVMGLLVALTVAITILLPNGITSHDIQNVEIERQNLQAIGQGSKIYLRENRTWPPTLAAHNPGYAPFASTKLTQNTRLFPRYYFAHPNTGTFANGNGLAESDLTDVRFLLVSNLEADATPTITNAAEFETWWTTDESATPGLHIYRGNLASQFHQVTLKAIDDGGSYQIDGTTTNSGGGLLADYSRYHVAGTVVGLDEGNTYGTPEVQFALTGHVVYQFDPLCSVGFRWRIVPAEPCLPSAVLWLTTDGDGVLNNSQAGSFDEPNLTYESGPTGTTSGTFSAQFDLNNFTGSASLDAVHYVTRSLTIGTTTPIDVYIGDILFSLTDAATLTSTNSLTVDDADVTIFRPDNPGDYTAGTFIVLIDGSDLSLPSGDVKGVSLVEQMTTVGGANLSQGTFLLNMQNERDILHLTLTSAGTTTSGSYSVLVEGADIQIESSNYLSGVHLIGSDVGIGDARLQSGQILVTTNENDNAFGDNGIPVTKQDIIILDVTTTGVNTAATATLLFDGSDLGLTSSPDDIDGITLVPKYIFVAQSIVNPGFETGDLTGWIKTGDLTGNGGYNDWGATTSTSAMSVPHSGTYFADAKSTGAVTGILFHELGVYQRLDLSASIAEIDAGKATASFSGFGHGETPGGCCDDKAKLRITFYNAVAGGSPIGVSYDSVWANTTNTWDPLFIYHAPVPAGTRSIELLLLGRKEIGGSKLDGGIDDVRGTLTIAP
ncbi:hypothetical protein [Candidatus Nitrospira salsa]